MNDRPTSPDTPQPLRNLLIDAILFRIEQSVLDEIPPEFPDETRQALLEEVVPNSRFILESLGTDELQNDLALDRHIEGVLATTVYLVHRIQEQRRRRS